MRVPRSQLPAWHRLCLNFREEQLIEQASLPDKILRRLICSVQPS
jgi:hypothetical protein